MLKKILQFFITHKKPLLNFCRVIFTVGPFIWIISRMHINSLVDAVAKVSWWTIYVVIGVAIISTVLQGMRWWMLMRAFNPELKLLTALYCHIVAGFYSIVLPTNAAQDFVRAFLISKHVNSGVGWGSTWVSRLLGLFAWLLMAMYGFFSIKDSVFNTKASFVLMSIFVAALILTALSFSKKLTRPIRALFEKKSPAKILKTVKEIRQSVYEYREKKRQVAGIFLFTLFIQAVQLIGAAYAIYGICGKLFIKECFAFTPTIELVLMTVAITPNGMGIREGLNVLFYGTLGITVEQVGIYSAFMFLGIILRLIGGIVLVPELLKKRFRKE